MRRLSRRRDSLMNDSWTGDSAFSASSRDMRGGRDYQAQFGRRMQGEGVWADLLAQRFAAACTRLGLNGERRGVLDCSQFRPPGLNGQQSLF